MLRRYRAQRNGKRYRTNELNGTLLAANESEHVRDHEPRSTLVPVLERFE